MKKSSGFIHVDSQRQRNSREEGVCGDNSRGSDCTDAVRRGKTLACGRLFILDEQTAGGEDATAMTVQGLIILGCWALHPISKPCFLYRHDKGVRFLVS